MSSEKYFYLALNDPLESHTAEAKVFKVLQREPFLSQMTIIEIFKLGSLPSMVTPVLSIRKYDALNKTFVSFYQFMFICQKPYFFLSLILDIVK